MTEINLHKQGYLVSITNDQLADVYPVRVLSPEEQQAAQEEATERSRQYVAGITARLATAHPTLHPVIDLHSCDQYGECDGCDSGAYAESNANWPCRTIELILEGLA